MRNSGFLLSFVLSAGLVVRGLPALAQGTSTLPPQVNLKDFGAKGDGIADDTMPIIAWLKAIGAGGGHKTAIAPEGTYRFAPAAHFKVAYQWRGQVELVDVKQVRILGYGATFQQDIPANWNIGDPATLGNDEGPFQFRSSIPGGCSDIQVEGVGVYALKRHTKVVNDGNCFGIAFRAVDDVRVSNVKCCNWGTDGLYLGRSYGEKFDGTRAIVRDSLFDNNTRQAASVTGSNEVTFTGCYFSNCNGGTFGYGIDFEPNGGVIENMIVQGCHFKNNSFGSLNFVSVNNVVVQGCTMEETHPDSNGAIFNDGPSTNVHIEGCNIKATRTVLYIKGNNISGFTFQNNIATIVGTPLVGPIRVNPFSNLKNLDHFVIRGNVFNGPGGILFQPTGTCWIENNLFNVYKGGSTKSDCWSFAISGTGFTYFKDNTIIIDPSVTHQGVNDAYMIAGQFAGNTLVSHPGSPVSIRNTGAGRQVSIGMNYFSPNWYFASDTPARELREPGTPANR